MSLNTISPPGISDMEDSLNRPEIVLISPEHLSENEVQVQDCSGKVETITLNKPVGSETKPDISPLKTLVRKNKVNFITPKAFSDGQEFKKMRKSAFLSARQNDFNLDSMVLIRDDPLPNCIKAVILKARKSGLKNISDAYHDIGIRALYYSFTPKKENNMSQDLIQAIRVISGTEQKDELSRFENMPANIKEAMNRKMAARQQEASEKVADQLITLLDSAAGHKIRYLQLSRSLRTQMNAAIANVKRFHAAEQLADAGNFAPLVLVVHGTTGFTVDEIKKIEQDLEDQIKKDSAEPKTASAARKRSA